jgi:hypothetical protein
MFCVVIIIELYSLDCNINIVFIVFQFNLDEILDDLDENLEEE